MGCVIGFSGREGFKPASRPHPTERFRPGGDFWFVLGVPRDDHRHSAAQRVLDSTESTVRDVHVGERHEQFVGQKLCHPNVGWNSTDVVDGPVLTTTMTSL